MATKVRERYATTVRKYPLPLGSEAGHLHKPLLVEEANGSSGGDEGGRGGGYSSVACLSHLTVDQSFLSRRSTGPPRGEDTSNGRALISFVPYIM